MSDKYDETYEIVVAMAKAKMMMNSHKGAIEDMGPIALVEKGKLEFDELEEAITSKDYAHIVEEVADVLNFAVAAAHKAIQDYRSRK